MNPNPFDWTAEPFLSLYAGLAVALFAVGFWLRASLGAGAARLPQLDEWEWAYLAGGAERVCDVALLRLAMQNGAAAKGRKIVVSDPTPLGGIGGACSLRRDDPMTRADFRRAIEPIVERARGRLQALGFCPSDDQVRAFRHAILPFVGALLAFGAIKAAVGASRQHPIGILLVFLFATFVAAILLAKRPTRTRAGGEALKAHRVAYARAARSPLEQELPLAVALSGTVVLSGAAYAWVHESSRAARQSADGGGCGGGGCGGGGCGGCS